MIIGIGTDIVDIDRISKNLDQHGARFEKRCFTDAEQAYADASPQGQKAEKYAKRFAAKEACAKALGCGFVDDVNMTDIGVVHDDLGKPMLNITGGARKKLDVLVPENMQPAVHLSLSDEPPYAQAFVIIEAIAR